MLYQSALGQGSIKLTALGRTDLRCQGQDEELFVFKDIIGGPRAPAVEPGRVTQA
jgi:hypothetical protein